MLDSFATAPQLDLRELTKFEMFCTVAELANKTNTKPTHRAYKLAARVQKHAPLFAHVSWLCNVAVSKSKLAMPAALFYLKFNYFGPRLSGRIFVDVLD